MVLWYWYYGIVVLRYCGIVVLRYCGIVVLQYCGTTVLWYWGTVLLGYCGIGVLGYCGNVVLGYYGTTVLWYYGTVVPANKDIHKNEILKEPQITVPETPGVANVRTRAASLSFASLYFILSSLYIF
jgi:hypothetical protein